MDDRELETRLRARLHERFDTAQPTPELVIGVRQAIATRPNAVGVASLRPRRTTSGWAPVAAFALVAVIALAGIGVGNFMVPGDPRPSPTPGSTPNETAERWFIALPEFGTTPTRADVETARDVLVARLQALGVQPVVQQANPGVAFEVMTGDATDDAIRAVLGAVGDIAFVPLPPEDYGPHGDGRVKAVVGEPLPTDPSALFGWDGVASVALGDPQEGVTDAPQPLRFILSDSGRATFAAWSEAHVDETLAVVIDGRVAFLPMISSPVPDGNVLLAPALAVGDRDARERYERTAAILIGGRLPSAFGDVTSPAIVPVEDVIAATQRELPSANGLIWQLDAISDERQWLPIWRVTFGGQFTPDCTPSLTGPACVVYTRLIATFDASDGVPIEREFQDIH